MPRPRTPLALARLTGRDKVAPARFKGRREPKSPPLAGPPRWMKCKIQREAWNDFRREIPWLRQADCFLVGIACAMRARLAQGTASTKAMNLLRMCLASMGAVPVSQIGMVPAEEDPDDALFERPNR